MRIALWRALSGEFLVEAEHLLAAADNAELGGGGEPIDCDELRRRAVEGERLTELLAGMVISNEAHDIGVCAEAGEIDGNIGGATRLAGLSLDANDGNGGFRGDACDVSPDVLV